MTATPLEQRVLTSTVLQLVPKIEAVRLGGTDVSLVHDITPYVQMGGSYISRNVHDPLGGVATLMVNEDALEYFSPSKHFIKITMTLLDVLGGESITRPMGVYLPQPTTRSIDPQIAIEMPCVDIASLLDNDMTASFSTVPNEQAQYAIRRAYQASGCPLPLTLPVIDYIFSDYLSEVWLASDEITWLDCINDMLRSTGNIGIYSDRNGDLTSKPYYFINEVSPIWDFNEASGVSINSGIEYNYWDIPNRWTGIANQQDFLDQLDMSTYTLTNEKVGRSSFEETGRWKDRTFNVDAVTRAALEQQVLWRAQLDQQVAMRVRIENTINLLFWVGDVVSLNLPSIGLSDQRGVVSDWTIPFDSLTMDIEVEVPA